LTGAARLQHTRGSFFFLQLNRRSPWPRLILPASCRPRSRHAAP